MKEADDFVSHLTRPPFCHFQMTVNVLPLGNVSLTEGQIRATVRGLKSRSVALPESMQDVSKYEVVGVEVPPGICE